MNRFGKAAVLLAAVSLASQLGSCGMAKRNQSVIESVAQSSANEEEPDQEIHSGLKIDFDEAQDSCEELIKEK